MVLTLTWIIGLLFKLCRVELNSSSPARGHGCWTHSLQVGAFLELAFASSVVLFQKSTSTKSTRNCFVHRWNGLTILRTGPRCQVTENTFIEDPPKCQFYDFTFSFLLRMRPAVIGRWQQFCPSQSAASFPCCDCCDSCAVHKFKLRR